MAESGSALAGYLGREVIMGIRPSDFEHGTIANAQWPRLQVTASVTEELGSEIHVIFAMNSPPVGHPSLSGTISDEAEEEAIHSACGSRWVARIAARSQVEVGQRVDLAVDTVNLHFFDPATGLAIALGSR